MSERRAQRPEIRRVRLDRDDAAGPVVRSEDQSGSPQRCLWPTTGWRAPTGRTPRLPVARSAGPPTRPPAQPIPASFSTTLDSAEKSSRPYPGARRRGEHLAHCGSGRERDAGARRVTEGEVEVLRHQVGHEPGLPVVRCGALGDRHPATGSRVRTATQSPVEWVSTSRSCEGSAPERSARAVASAVASIWAA